MGDETDDAVIRLRNGVLDVWRPNGQPVTVGADDMRVIVLANGKRQLLAEGHRSVIDALRGREDVAASRIATTDEMSCAVAVTRLHCVGLQLSGWPSRASAERIELAEKIWALGSDVSVRIREVYDGNEALVDVGITESMGLFSAGGEAIVGRESPVQYLARTLAPLPLEGMHGVLIATLARYVGALRLIDPADDQLIAQRETALLMSFAYGDIVQHSNASNHH